MLFLDISANVYVGFSEKKILYFIKYNISYRQDKLRSNKNNKMFLTDLNWKFYINKHFGKLWWQELYTIY